MIDLDGKVAVVTGAGGVFCAGADMSGGGATFDADAVAVEVDSCPLSMQAFEVRKLLLVESSVEKRNPSDSHASVSKRRR